MSDPYIPSNSLKAQEFQKNTAFLEKIAELGPDLLFVIDLREQKIIYVNKKVKELLGHDAEYVYAKGPEIFKTVLHPDDYKRRLENFEKCRKLSDQKESEVEVRFRTAGGDWEWFKIKNQVFKREENGSITQVIGTARSIHEQKAGEEKLQLEEELTKKANDRYKELFNSIDQGFCTIRVKYNEIDKPVDYQFLEVSPSFENQTGIKEGAGRWMRDIAADQDEFWFEVYGRVAKNRKAERFEYFSTPLGRWWNVYAFPIDDPALRRIGVLFNDITEAKQAEQALMQAKEKAEAAARTKEDFLSTMSHEIRTPLNAVIGLTNLLLSQEPREDQKENLNSLSFSAKNLMGLINDILDFSKLEAGKVDLAENTFDLLNLLFSLKQAHQPQAQTNGSQLKLSLDPEVPKQISTDQLKLSQVLHNLVSNAVKFTRQGLVKIEVSLQRQEEETLWLDFIVEDNGIGIPGDKLEYIFEKFTQADSSTIRHYGGTGLGLSITKMLLELMGSQIRVESEEGVGSRFFFTLPVKAGLQESASESPAGPGEYHDLRDLRILLVEDVALNRTIVGQFLQSWWQLEADEAVNGKEALEMARAKVYDIILMDVRMPEMDGYEATRLIRELPGYKTTPIIALTADKGVETKQKLDAASFTDLVLKPFEPKELQQKILQYVPAPEKAMPERDKAAYQLMKTHLNKNARLTDELKKLSLKHLKEYKENFKEALQERNEEKLADIEHKAQVLINLLDLEELHRMLLKSRKLLAENADAIMLEKTGKEVEALFDREIGQL